MQRISTMNALAQRHGTAALAAPRAREAARFEGLMANGSWSIRSCFVVPTTDHKYEPRRLTVIPT
jgi:hypothetical protein